MHDDTAPAATGSAARTHAPSSDTVRGRFGYVDALRGMAIVAMVLYELHHHGVIVADGLAGHLFSEGSRALDLVFVISGFSLAYPALSVLRADGRVGLDLGRFAIRRIARIVPAAWMTIVVLVIVPPIAAGLQHGSLDAFRATLPPTGTVLRQIFFLQTPPAAPDAFWVVAVAIRWYLLFPALLLLWTRSQRAFLALGGAIVVLDALTRLNGLGLGELPAFMLGIVAADWRVRHFGFARWSLYLAVAAVFAGVALEAVVRGPLFAFAPFPTDNLGWQAAAFFLLTGIGYSIAAERLFDTAFFATAGSVSYAIALVIEPITMTAGPFAQRLSTIGSRALGRTTSMRGRGIAVRIGHAVAPGTPLSDGLEIVFVALSILIVGLLLYRLFDRSVFERDGRMRLADRLEPGLARLFALLHTTGILELGRPADELRFEASSDGASAEFYAPPPRGDDTAFASVTRRSGSTQDLEEEMIATKKRLAERTTAMFADAEYEANRAKGIVTAPVAFPFQTAPPPGLSNASATVYGAEHDVWQKPRPAPSEPLPPSHPVVLEMHGDRDGEERAPDIVTSAPAPPPTPAPVGDAAAPVVHPPATEEPVRATERPAAPIRFKIGGSPGADAARENAPDRTGGDA